MATFPIYILSPQGQNSRIETSEHMPGSATDLSGPVALLSNGKTNVDHFFAAMRRELTAMDVRQIGMFEKPTVSRALPRNMFNEIATSYRIVVAAMCD